jgi:hypothetical protein
MKPTKQKSENGLGVLRRDASADSVAQADIDLQKQGKYRFGIEIFFC